MGMLLFNLKTYLNVEDSLKVAAELGALETEHEVLIAPQVLSLHSFSKIPIKKNTYICAQNFDYSENYGAHTGDVLIQDLKSIGCKYALVGHSEVRHRTKPRVGENDDLISKKVNLCIENAVTPVLCFGETKGEKEADQTEKVIVRQLNSALASLQSPSDKEIVLAYEPVWAISAAKGSESCGIDYVRKVFELTKNTVGNKIRYRFLYGGSVNGENIRGYIDSGFVDGVLIGRAGTESESLAKIIGAL